MALEASIGREVASQPQREMALEPSGEHDFDMLLLDNQLCFRLYLASKEIINRYHPYLEPLGLTYTQYITMMVIWEERSVSMKDLCERLSLKSSTLTPLVKKLEAAGYVARERSKDDERSLIVSLTQAGLELRDRARAVPECVSRDIDLQVEEAVALAAALDKLIAVIGR